jgi:hypothetical protein
MNDIPEHSQVRLLITNSKGKVIMDEHRDELEWTKDCLEAQIRNNKTLSKAYRESKEKLITLKKMARDAGSAEHLRKFILENLP